MSAISFQDLQPCISHLTIGGTNLLGLFKQRMPLTNLTFPLADLLIVCFNKRIKALETSWDPEQKTLAAIEERNVKHLTPLVKAHLSKVLNDQKKDPEFLNIRAILASIRLLSKVHLEGVDQKTLIKAWVQKAREAIQRLPISHNEPLMLLDNPVLLEGNNKKTKAIVEKVLKLLPPMIY